MKPEELVCPLCRHLASQHRPKMIAGIPLPGGPFVGCTFGKKCDCTVSGELPKRP
jgi:hypothetical protein